MKTAWRAHTGFVAWPTLALAFVVLGGWSATWVAVVGAGLPLGWGALINTALTYLAFTVLHEAVHGNVGGTANRAWIDTVAGTLAGALLAGPFCGFRAVHLRHHSTTNDPDKDPDMHVKGSHPVTIAARCLTIMPHYYRLILTAKEGVFQRVRGSAIRDLILMVGLWGLLVAAGLGAELLWLWVVPAWLAGGLLAFLLDWVPHHPHEVRGRGKDTRVVVGPGLTPLMMAQNLHAVHHLYPRIVWYRYPAFFMAHRDEIVAGGAPVTEWRLVS